MAYQRGSLKQVPRKEGDTWMLRYRVVTTDGRRVENGLTVGLVRDFPSEKSAWREVWTGWACSSASTATPLPLAASCSTRFASTISSADFGADAVRPKSANTIPIVEHYVRDYLTARWGSEIAEDIKPLDIQRWMKSLHTDNGLAWTTISKIRGIMHRVYKVGILHELVPLRIFGRKRRDPFKVQLPRHRHRPGPDLRHPWQAHPPLALRADAHMRGNSSQRI